MDPSTPASQHFPRFLPAANDRSPSRSPRRKAQFAFRELDPLLGNLSPDSTLKALRATDTISNGAAQEDALTSSIADATPAEREIGIRAAFAAQKLREWRDEITRWKWPGKQERAFGLGFVNPPQAQNQGTYHGCLPAPLVGEYESRLEEVRDDLESLDIDEIKDHVLESHRPTSGGAKSSRPAPVPARASYGRMRDFTALITATVIQALPDLAKLNRLLDTWDIRLRVLRELPRFLDIMQGAETGIQRASRESRDPVSAQSLTEAILDNKKLTLGGQVSDMGRRVDRLLDMLEGQEDTLPQAWIDRLDKIELDYASWVVEAQHVVLKNQLSPKPSHATKPVNIAHNPTITSQGATNTTAAHRSTPDESVFPVVAASAMRKAVPQSVPNKIDDATGKPKSPLTLDLSQPKSHKREASKVSVADSTYSTFSDISNAEIVDAKSTSVLPSPKISLVDSPFRASRDEVTWFGSTPAAQQHMTSKPPMLQRASTASIEVFPKEKLKEVVLRRTASWDMVSAMNSPDGTPSKALKQLTGDDSPIPKTLGTALVQSPLSLSAETTPLPTPSLQVQPLRPSSRRGFQPELPRRSSKRNTLTGMSPVAPATSLGTENGTSAVECMGSDSKEQVRRHKKSESLEEKIQDILTTLPTKIRLAKDVDSAATSSTTRSSTPTPALTLSPAKADPSSRKGSLADPDIKLYHLTRTGQGREAPPVKLFVRTIGDGDRVMVRVGGGWADLAEYLKEYSLHHGSRATADGRLEVASFPPGNGQISTINGSVSQGRRKTKSPPLTEPTFAVDALLNAKVRSSTQQPPPPEQRRSIGEAILPPVPPIPSSYTVNSAAIASTSRKQAGIVTETVQSDPGNPETPLQTKYSVVHGATGTTTTTTVTPPVVTTNYTPLGGAGPKMNARRAVTIGATPDTNDVWVQGMVGKARAVSGSSPAIVQGSNSTSTTVTTTTTITSTPPSSARRASSYFGITPHPNANPHASPVTISSTPSTRSVANEGKPSRRASYAPPSRKNSRMSLSDIRGIKRVFLRKKLDESVK